MTIDEAIMFCDEKSKNIKLKADPQVFIDIAEWLEELKEARKGFNENRKAGYKHGYSDGYNKAIDDLVLQCKKVHARGLITNWGKPFGIEFDKLDDIAQQLKAGDPDGNSTTDN